MLNLSAKLNVLASEIENCSEYFNMDDAKLLRQAARALEGFPVDSSKVRLSIEVDPADLSMLSHILSYARGKADLVSRSVNVPIALAARSCGGYLDDLLVCIRAARDLAIMFSILKRNRNE